jgi:uncharacterized membrane protein YcgQ (UPF0703/DUF1980 family)
MFKSIYEFKSLLLDKDVEALKNMIKEQNPSLTVQNNNDRTIRIDCNTNQFDSVMNSIESLLPNWAGKELPCSANMIYNVFPLNNTAYLLKV